MNSIDALIASIDAVSLTNSQDRYPHHTNKAESGLPLLHIHNRYCEAVIAPQGAHVLEFTPTDSSPLLWLSPKAKFAKGQAIRGGIPVCLPWFGVNQRDPDKPKHGFVRNRDWQLTQVSSTDTGATQLVFAFSYSDIEPKLFAYPFQVTLTITLSHNLELTLSVTNTGTETMPFSWALHSYHPVANLATTQVEGLDGKRYLDNTRGLQPAIQSGAVVFDGEVDRAYEQVDATQILNGNPRITVTGENCDSAIVWNPGGELASTIGDIGRDAYDQFVCVERGAAFGDEWELGAGESRVGRLTVAVG